MMLQPVSNHTLTSAFFSHGSAQVRKNGHRSISSEHLANALLESADAAFSFRFFLSYRKSSGFSVFGSDFSLRFSFR